MSTPRLGSAKLKPRGGGSCFSPLHRKWRAPAQHCGRAAAGWRGAARLRSRRHVRERRDRCLWADRGVGRTRRIGAAAVPDNSRLEIGKSRLSAPRCVLALTFPGASARAGGGGRWIASGHRQQACCRRCRRRDCSVRMCCVVCRPSPARRLWDRGRTSRVT
eukprot:235178-Chlamydomonas_euryale.AAC.3